MHRRAYTCRALLCLLFALRDKGAALGTVLGRLVFPALIRTLSTAGSEQFVHPVTGTQILLFGMARGFNRFALPDVMLPLYTVYTGTNCILVLLATHVVLCYPLI